MLARVPGRRGRALRPPALPQITFRLLGSSLASDGTYLWGLLLAVAVNLATYGYVWWLLPTLPSLMPLHYDGAGVVDLIGPPGELFKLPGIGTLVLLATLVFGVALHGRERPAAQVLIWTSLAVQVALAVGVQTLAARAAGE